MFSSESQSSRQEPVYILTPVLDEATFLVLDRLRKRYFPPERNFIRAHATLFHALPESQLNEVIADLEREVHSRTTFSATLGPPYSLGAGVAFSLDCAELQDLVTRWQSRWRPFLTRQDSAKKRLHITIQNKVDAATARRTLEEVRATAIPSVVTIEGFELFLYQGGPWKSERRWRLRPV